MPGDRAPRGAFDRVAWSARTRFTRRPPSRASARDGFVRASPAPLPRTGQRCDRSTSTSRNVLFFSSTRVSWAPGSSQPLRAARLDFDAGSLLGCACALPAFDPSSPGDLTFHDVPSASADRPAPALECSSNARRTIEPLTPLSLPAMRRRWWSTLVFPTDRAAGRRDRFRVTRRETGHAFPVRGAFPRQGPFSGLHRIACRKLPAMHRLTTSFHPQPGRDALQHPARPAR